MSKTLSAKYYQEKKERLKKSLQKITKSLQKRNKKSGNMVENITKISQKMKYKSLLGIEKNIIE